MKNTFKKIGALALVIIMMLSLSVTAFAESASLDKDDNDASTVKAAVKGTDITDLTYKVYFNENKGAVAHPAATFTYTLAAGTAVANYGIEAGNLDLVGFGNTSTNTTTAVWNVNDTNVSKDVKIVFGAFTKSGIYRYNVTQSKIEGDMEKIGIVSEDSGSTDAVTMNLDVYVDNTLKVVGAVLAKSDATLSKVTGTEGDVMQYTGKVDGFRNKLGDNTKPDDPENPKPGEDTIGYKVIITKTVSGNMADTSYKFPFSVAVTKATSLDDGLKLKVAATNSDSTSKVTVPTGDVTVGTAFEIAIANGGSVTISGLTKAEALEVVEKVDATEGYTVAIAKTDSEWAAVPTIADNTSAVTNKVDNTKITATLKDSDATIKYTNTRNSISPTGVVLRVAPYAIILGAGIFFLLVSKRRKEESEA